MFASGSIIYAYVGGNPVNYTDPLGLNPASGAIGGGEAGLVICGPACAVVGAIAGGIAGEVVIEAIIDAIVDPYRNEDLTNSIGKISDKTGLSPEQVRDRIHAAKKRLPKSATKKNPDCQVDVKTGEIFPEIPDGGVGDSIGNIFDE